MAAGVTVVAYVTDTACLERLGSTEHRASEAGGAPSRHSSIMSTPCSLPVSSSSDSSAFVSRAIDSGPLHGLVDSAAYGTI